MGGADNRRQHPRHDPAKAGRNGSRSGFAEHFALAAALPRPFVALACPYRYGRAAAIPMAVGRWGTWGNAIAGALGWWDRWRCPGTCQTSETITPPTARSLPSLSTIIVLAGAEINAETDIRPPATAPATLKRPGGTPAGARPTKIGQAKT